MSEGTFHKVGHTHKRMYGTLKLLVCGYQPDEQDLFLSFLGQVGMGNIPTVFVSEKDAGVSLKGLLDRPDRSGLGQESNMRRAVIMSGFTEKGLHKLISSYRQAQLPNQLWATLTPISENWTIAQLLEELAKEAEAMKRRQRQA